MHDLKLYAVERCIKVFTFESKYYIVDILDWINEQYEEGFYDISKDDIDDWIAHEVSVMKGKE